MIFRTRLSKIFTLHSLFTVTFLSAVLSVPARAGSIDIACVIEQEKTYTSAQDQFQIDLTALIIRTSPDLKEVSELFLSDQRNLIEMRRIAVEVLIHSEPDKVHVDSNINQWLDLSKEDKQIIAKRNKRYAELLNLLDSAKTRPAHPDGDKVRALMRDKISGMDEYKNLIAKLLTVIDKINSSKCNSRK